jgi:2-polyprenyl-3-methyl-5-hydroxy-6-metoxy-1,4-benzoquinol methylase
MLRWLSWLLVAVAGAGLAATMFWLEASDAREFARERLPALASCLGVIVSCTTVNLAIRWVRWHFLLRRLDVRIHTRDSIRLYFATLPAIATPLYLGELVRAPLLVRRFPEARRAVPLVWIVERLTDATVLSCMLLYAVGAARWALVLIATWTFGMAVLRGWARPLAKPLMIAALFGATALAWALPLLALWVSLLILGAPLPGPTVAGVFSYGTLLGGVAGIPLGTGVTGSAMIVALDNVGMPNDLAVAAVAVFRAGTAWYAVALGLATFLRSRRKVAAFRREPAPNNHFDQIAGDYGRQIPEHIRDRLLERKVGVMQRRLEEHGIRPGSRGLDVGCGQGWYACELALAGYVMSGFDQAPDQIAAARDYANSLGASVDLAVLDASHLPFADATFDFVYSINVLHHILAPEARAAVLREIVRVLRPGGVFFLHEINTENPLFRGYMGYLFPLLCDIDEGTERWVRPSQLPQVEGAAWHPVTDYFTFLPDFTPRLALAWLRPLEAWLERSPLRRWSAHFVATLQKDAGA